MPASRSRGTLRPTLPGFVLPALVTVALLVRPANGQGCTDYATEIQYHGAVAAPSSGTDSRQIERSGDYAFVLWLNGVIQILDITDPSAPMPVGEVGAGVQRFVFAGQTLHAIDGASLLTVDITDPANPAQLSSFPLAAIGTGLGRNNNLVYVGSSSGMSIVDVSDPEAPVLAAAPSLIVPPTEMVFNGTYLYLGMPNGIYVADISDPLTPTFVAYRPGPTVEEMEWFGSHIVTAAGGNLEIRNVSDPTNPTVIASTAGGPQINTFWIDGTEAHCAGSDLPGVLAGVSAVDLSNPGAPQVRYTFNTPGSARGVVAAGGYAVVSCQTEGVLVYDLGAGNRMEPYSMIPVPVPLGSTLEIAAGTSYAHFTVKVPVLQTFHSTVYAVDTSDPLAPVVTDSLFMMSELLVRGDRAVRVTPGKIAQFWDLSDPATIVSGGSYSFGPGTPQGIALGAGVAYVRVSGATGTTIERLDTSDAQNPVLLPSTLPYPESAEMIPVPGALIRNFGYKMDVIRLAPPWEIAAAYPFSGSSVDFHVEGNLVFRATAQSGVEIIDLSDPFNPEAATTLTFPYDVFAVAADGPFVYVTLDELGLQIYDLTVPSEPVFVGATDQPTPYGTLAEAGGDALYIWDGGTTIFSLPLQCTAAAVTTPVLPASSVASLAVMGFPNPSRGPTGVRFTLGSARNVELSVYNLAGRRVRDVSSGERYAAGSHRVGWDGRDTAGRPLAQELAEKSGTELVQVLGRTALLYR